MKVRIVKEVKRSDGLWRFACGDVYHLHLISLLTLLLICTHVNHHQGSRTFHKNIIWGGQIFTTSFSHGFVHICLSLHICAMNFLVSVNISIFPSLPICPGHFLHNLCQPYYRGIVLGSDILTNSYEHCVSKHIFISWKHHTLHNWKCHEATSSSWSSIRWSCWGRSRCRWQRGWWGGALCWRKLHKVICHIVI